MSQRVIQGTPKLAEAIRNRRQELGLTIEEAAVRANVGVKTWYRYESGESIRQDKAKSICKTLNWYVLPEEAEENQVKFDFSEYRNHEAWSQFICDNYGAAAAISFVIGSDIALDYLEDDLKELSTMPVGTHVGQLSLSMLKDVLPAQFLMRYDYEFLYGLKATVQRLRAIAHSGGEFRAHSVMQELALYLFTEEAEFLMECMLPEMEACGVSNLDMWKGWMFDFFEDKDIVTALYTDCYLTQDNNYHFDHWTEEQFFM